MGLIVGALVNAACALYVLRQAVRHKSKKALKLVKTARRLRDLFKIFSVVPKAKILFGFYQVAWGFGACALCVIAPGICCGSYSPCGAFDRPTGCARDEARNGAIGATALKWLSMFLRGEEQGEGPERPIIASGWECVGLDMSRV